jgi:hypothetical protein
MLRRALTVVLASLAVAAGATPAARAQTGWIETFGGADPQTATCVAARADGGLFVAGRTFTAQGSDVWVARLDPSGLPLWERFLGGSGGDEAASVLATADGGCLVAGVTSSFGAGGDDGWIVKLAADGSVDWQRAYGDASDQEFQALAGSPDGYYVGGTTEDATTGLDTWVLEIDAQGDVLWSERFAGDLEDRLRSLSATDDGLILTSNSRSNLLPALIPGVPFFRPWVVKLDGDGNVQWQKAYNYSGGDAWAEILPVAGGGYLAVGEILAMAFFRGDVWVVRLDEDGDVVWDRRYGDNFGTTFVDSAYGAVQTADGGFAVVASTATAGAGSEDAWVLKLDAAGLREWDHTYGRDTFDNGTAIDAAPNGDLLAAGFLGGRALVMRLEPEAGTTCDLAGPTQPNEWTDVLPYASVLLAPSPFAVAVEDTPAVASAASTAVFLCPPPDPSFCDATDGALASCPCANPGLPDTGCDLAQGTGGVGLAVLAQETAPQNRATLRGAGFPATSSPAVVVLRAAALDPSAPVVFGDGLRCVGVPLVRLAATLASGGLSVHVIGHGAGSGTYAYQLWLRNQPIMFCDPVAAFNLSNGRALTW